MKLKGTRLNLTRFLLGKSISVEILFYFLAPKQNNSRNFDDDYAGHANKSGVPRDETPAVKCVKFQSFHLREKIWLAPDLDFSVF